MLNDAHMNAAQTLIRKQFAVAGLQHTLVAQAPDGMLSGFDAKDAERPSLQIHHTAAAHWDVSGWIAQQVYFLDSIYSVPNEYVRMQLVQCYGKGQEVLPFTVQPSQQQTGGRQCGDFSICNIFELARGTSPADLSGKRFDQQKMRDHLLQCFEAGKLTPFPELSADSSRRSDRRKPKTYLLDCDSLQLQVLAVGSPVHPLAQCSLLVFLQ